MEEQQIDHTPQTGPLYYCPVCGEPAYRLIPYSEHATGNGHLDAWGDHIAYLDLHPDCREAGHPARVAILGAAVAPLIFPRGPDGTVITGECVALIRQTLDTLAQEAGPQAAHEPVAAIVYRLAAGLISPQAAVEEIHALVEAPLKNTGIVGKPYFVESSGYEGIAIVLSVNNDDTVNVRSDYTGQIHIVEKDDLTCPYDPRNYE